jgi:D-glycero-alpha-D-manno-heptose 1-phosphate guanylyltransferase
MREAIVLAGGLGTRLRSVIEDVPKVMAPINEKPFLEYLFLWLEKYEFTRVVLAVGYKYEIIKEYFGEQFYNMEIVYSIEENPLGTGGAIKLALECSKASNVLVVNGDTFFNVNLSKMLVFHLDRNFDISIALKPMSNFDRYGKIMVAKDDLILGFKEKEMTVSGLINGGIYYLKRNCLSSLPSFVKFSFELDFLENQYKSLQIGGFKSDEYFIDIGIPRDYCKAQKDLPLL